MKQRFFCCNCSLVAIVAACMQAVADPPAVSDLPFELRAMIDGRRALRTGEVRYAHRLDGPGGHRRFRSRVAFDSSAVEWLGDEKGEFAGRPVQLDRTKPDEWFQAALVRDGELWQYNSQAPTDLLYKPIGEGDRGVVNVVSLGVTYFPTSKNAIDAVWEAIGPEPVVFQSSPRGEHIVVAAIRADRTVEWELDPSRDYQPVRVTLFELGERTAEVINSLELHGTTWFPTNAEFLDSSTHREAPRQQRIEVEAAEFNAPGQATTFTPADIGAEPGFMVRSFDFDPAKERGIWDGRESVSPQEFRRRLTRDEVQLTERGRRLAFSRRPKKPIPPGLLLERLILRASSPASEWREYVEHFIRNHHCDPEQIAAAYKILADCEEQATRFIQRKEPSYDALEKERLALLKRTAPPSQDEVDALISRYLTEKAELREIFKKQLVPRLDKLLTREQVRAAASQPTSAPSSSNGDRLRRSR